jgi:LuxR family maltose regulon positive regulatory protein
MAKTTPIVRENTLTYQQDGQEQVLLVETAAWYAWLETASSFAFTSQAGTFTARKERAGNQRGGWYWKAYRTHHGKLTSLYLGKSETVTLARLKAVAQALADALVETAPDNDAGAAGSPVQAAAPGMRGDSLSPLLSTKLHRPLPRAHLVRRPHLGERLAQGVLGPLTLVSAPAGFGKTTLLAQWFVESGMPVAWLSLEPPDNELVRFLSYLIAALQTLDPQLGSVALPLLQSPHPAAPETVLTLLTNDVVSRARDRGDFALVLDDYHVIEAAPIHQALLFLLEHLPPQMHLILATRADPPLPLSRLRARGQLTELRAAELRFATQEVQTFLRTVMGLDLSTQEMALLQQRTEGWIAGLQLAALSLRGRSDVSAFLAAFSGSHRFVLDYLSEEVLTRQPAEVQAFLLQTSILDRLSGPLCEAVTEQKGSQAMLEALEQANLFVVSLDDERRWYRYHHLFAEVLRSHLFQTQPRLVPALHRRASLWYEQHQLPAEAVQHALAAPDFERASSLIEQCALPLALGGEINTVLAWLNTLPDELVRARPFLCLYHAALLSLTNRLEAAEARLEDAERCVGQGMPAEPAQSVLGWVFLTRAGLALFFGEIAQAVSLAHRALTLLPETEGDVRSSAILTAASAFLVSGDVAIASEREVVLAEASVHDSGNPHTAIRGICLLTQLHVLQGRLRVAAAVYAQGLQLMPLPEVLQTSNYLFYCFGLGELRYEHNELDEASQRLAQGMEMIREGMSVEAYVVALGYTAMARLQQARGDPSQALATLDTFTHLATARHFAPHWRAHMAAVRVQLELAQGNLASAISWMEASGLSCDDPELPYPREREYLALARVRIAQGRNDPAGPFLPEALHLLDRLLKDAEAKARMGSALEILVLQSLALQVLGDRARALSTLGRALTFAEPEGYVRLFVDEGRPMVALLRQAYARGIAPDYVATLLSVADAPKFPVLAPAGSLLEPLTEREREVLRLLVKGLSNHAMARELVVTVGTVKSHVNHIYGKLGVQSRTQAIARAHTLHLL